MVARGAVRTIVAVPLLLIWPALTPPLTAVLAVSVPLPTASVTVRSAEPLSTSVIERPVSASAVSSAVVGEAGRVLIGPSLTALTVTATAPLSVSVPPAPVLPRSEIVTERESAPLASATGAKVRPAESARVFAMASSGASMTTLAVPLPVTWPAAMPPLTVVEAVSVAFELTPRVNRTLAAPASTSVIVRPVIASALSSSVLRAPGRVRTGASLTGWTVMATAPVVIRAPP